MSSTSSQDKIIEIQTKIRESESKLLKLYDQLYEEKKKQITKVICYSCKSERCKHLDRPGN